MSTVPVLSEPTGDEELLLSAVCLAQEAIGTSGACCRCSFPCCPLILCTRLCAHDSRHAAHNGSRESHVFISSHMVAELVFIHGNTVTCFGEPPETDRRYLGVMNITYRWGAFAELGKCAQYWKSRSRIICINVELKSVL